MKIRFIRMIDKVPKREEMRVKIMRDWHCVIVPLYEVGPRRDQKERNNFTGQLLKESTVRVLRMKGRNEGRTHCY